MAGGLQTGAEVCKYTSGNIYCITVHAVHSDLDRDLLLLDRPALPLRPLAVVEELQDKQGGGISSKTRVGQQDLQA